jgi:hypothetical protein
MRVAVTRRKFDLSSYLYSKEELSYEGSGDLMPALQMLDDNRSTPGVSYQLKVFKPGRDEDGDRKADRYYIHGATTHIHGHWMVIEGYVMGDGSFDGEICECGDPRRTHVESVHRPCQRAGCDCGNFQPAREQYHVERWDVSYLDEEAATPQA